MDEFIYLFSIFLAATLSSIILNGFTDLATILKILSIIVLFVLIFLRISINSKIYNLLKGPILRIGGIYSISLFIMLLIVSTGGVISPLFIIIHIVTIALAFLLTFPIAMAFLFSSILAVMSQFYTTHFGVASNDSALLVIQAATVLALIPLSYVISKRYHLKGQLADSLFAELSISKNEEETILTDISEGVITLDTKFKIKKVNAPAQKMSGFDKKIIDKDFFETFKIFGQDKKQITKDHFPLKDLLQKESGFKESNLYLQKSDGEFLEIEFKFSSLNGSQDKIEAILFVFNQLNQFRNNSNDTILETSFEKFNTLLSEINTQISGLDDKDEDKSGLNRNSKRMLHAYRNLELLYKLNTGEVPGLLEDLDVGKEVRKIIEKTQDLAQQYGVDLVNSTPITPPLPIKTNKVIFDEALLKLMELSIFIAAAGSEKFTIISTGLSEENIFVFLKTSTFDNFPWDNAIELLQPFFGKASSLSQLSQASGLEGFLAERFLKEKGFEGGITGRKFEDGIHKPQLELTIILPYKSSKDSA